MAEVRILNSWKEISSYIGRGVRTVQRWEELYGLPVHRAAGKDRSAVHAMSDEIDAWLRLGKMHEQLKQHREVSLEAARNHEQMRERTRTLLERLRLLRKQTEQVRAQLKEQRQHHNGVRERLNESGVAIASAVKVARRA